MSRDRAFDPVFAAQEQREFVQPIDTGDLDILFTACIKVGSFFDEAKQFVQAYYFDSIREPHYGLLWQVMVSAREQFNEFVCSTLLDMISRQFGSANVMITVDMQDEMLRRDNSGIIYSAFMTPIEDVQLEYARSILRRFLHERTVIRPLQQVMASNFQGAYPVGLDVFLTDMQTHSQRISGLSAIPQLTTVPSLNEPLPPASTYHLTGLPFVDEKIGGQREGDCNGLIGATGAGKSTLAAHLIVASGRHSYHQAMAANKRPPINVLFTYEESVRKIYPRIWSAAMQIRRDKLERMQNFSELTQRHNMEEYERRMVTGGGEPLSEVERWQAHSSWLNTSVVLIDMSGSEDFPNAGSGYVPEMAVCLDRLVNQLQTEVRMAAIDYAGLVCTRYMDSHGIDESKLRYWLTRMGDDCRRQLSERFSCTTWLLHQLKAEAGSRSPVKLMHHTDAAESKAFAVNLATCGCLGVPDPRTGCRRLNWSKLRYASQERVEPVTLRINDMFAAMEDVGATYGIDESGGGFVSREELARFGGGVQSRLPRQQNVVNADPVVIRGHSSQVSGEAGVFYHHED